jgi:hypothetical protein
MMEWKWRTSRGVKILSDEKKQKKPLSKNTRVAVMVIGIGGLLALFAVITMAVK